ncbi:MAG: DUF4907 domain-containing protein [Saprospiraceae bacterium]
MNKIMYLFMGFICLFHLTACTGQSGSHETASSATPSYSIPDSQAQDLIKKKAVIAHQMADEQITYFVTHTADGKFGYNIFIDGKIYIEQQTIPAVAGNHGFATKEDAEKIALLAIEKLKRGEVPPSITVEELKEKQITINE